MQTSVIPVSVKGTAKRGGVRRGFLLARLRMLGVTEVTGVRWVLPDMLEGVCFCTEAKQRLGSMDSTAGLGTRSNTDFPYEIEV